MFFFSFEKTVTSHEIWMFLQKDCALRSSRLLIINYKDSQIRLIFFLKNGVSKIRKKYEKMRMYSDKLTNQFWLEKKLRYRFFVE